MSKVLCIGTCGAEEPARATMPFAAVLIAGEAGDKPALLLRANATLLKESVAKRIHADDWPALVELLQRVVAHGIPVYV